MTIRNVGITQRIHEFYNLIKKKTSTEQTSGYHFNNKNKNKNNNNNNNKIPLQVNLKNNQ